MFNKPLDHHKQNPPLTPDDKLRLALAALQAAIERLALSLDQVAAFLTRTSRWTPRPGTFGRGRCEMVEIILSEHQLASLKAAVPKGSIERAALDAGDYFAGSEITSEPIAVTLTCTVEVARQLLAIARTSCPDVATGIRATIDRQRT